MTQSVSWPPIGGSTFNIPEDGETNWPLLTNFLVSLGQKAQGTQSQKIGARIATSTPANIQAGTDCIVSVELSPNAAATVNLPAGNPGQYFGIVDGLRNAGTYNITVIPQPGETIQGAADYVMNANGSAVGIQFFNGDWKILWQAAGEGAGGGVSRSSIDAGTANWVVINGPDGKLSQEQRLAAVRGGLGVNASAASGFAKWSTGTPSWQATINDGDLGTGINANKIGGGSVSNTAYGYIANLSSDAQTQFGNINTALSGKADTSAVNTALAAKVDGAASSVDSEIMLYSGTTGKISKRMTGTGIVKVTSGVASVGTVGIAEGGTGQTSANAALNALLPSQTGNAAKFLQSDGTNTSWAAAVGGYQTQVVTANPAPAQNNVHYLANTQSSAFTITLPAGAAGAKIKISDDRGYWDVNNLTITPATGERIWPLATNASLVCNVVRGWIELLWDGGGWSPNSLASTTLGSGGGLVAQEVNSSLTAVNGVMYEYDMASGPYVLTLPVGTGAAVVGFQDRKGLATDAKYLRLNPDLVGSIDNYANGDTVDMNYANFSGVLYRPNGSTIWYRTKQLTSTVGPASTTETGTVTTTSQTFAGDKTFTGKVRSADIKSGFYSPVFSANSQFGGASSPIGIWEQNGDIVSVEIYANLTTGPSLGGICRGLISLPVARSGNFTSSTQAFGTLVWGNTTNPADRGYVAGYLLSNSGSQLMETFFPINIINSAANTVIQFKYSIT